MGNSSSSKLRHRSESMQIKKKSDDSFSKSKSMMNLGSKPKNKSISSIKEKDRPKLTSRDSTKSSSNVSRSKSIRRDTSHPISAGARDIITQSFENPHSEFGNKVLQRIFEKRPDYQGYVYAMGKEKAYLMSVRLKDLVEDVVAKIYDPDYITEISRVYGEEHVELKQFGFKPDFWVTIADAITVEGVILDQANHQPADTVAAWSSLVTLMFSSVRDGYYKELRRHRMSSRKCLRRQTTVDSTTVDSGPEAETAAPMTDSVLTVPDHARSISAQSSISTHSAASTESCGTQNGALPKRSGSINIMAPVVPTSATSIYNNSPQTLVTYRQKPIFE